MKLLLFTVALVHCACASQNGSQASNSQDENRLMEDVPAQGEVEDRLIVDDVDEKTPNGITSVLAEETEDVAVTLDNAKDVGAYEERQRLAEEQAKAEELGGLDGDEDGMIILIAGDEQTCLKCGGDSTPEKVDGAYRCVACGCDELSAPRFEIERKCLVGDKDNSKDDNMMTVNMVKNIIEGDKTAKEIEIKKVSGSTLALIVQYLEHHAGVGGAEIAKPIRSVKMSKIVEDPFDAAFIAIDRAEDHKDEVAQKAFGLVADQRKELDRKSPFLTKKEIFEIILGANYMDIKPLLHLGCAKIATLIKGKSPEEIKKILGDDEEDKKAKGLQKESGYRRRLLEAMSNF